MFRLRAFSSELLRLTPIALAVAAACPSVQAQVAVRPASAAATPKVDPADPATIEADKLSGRPDLDAQAEGSVVLKRGPITINADRLRYDTASDTARANGAVKIQRGRDRFSGTELELQLERFEGYFLQPDYFFSVTNAGGHAERIDFLDPDRTRLYGATYTSCPTDGSGGPAWLLSTTRVRLDFEANEGVAEGAVLRFYGVPILAAPTLSFPLNEERKSGWLPPTVNLDNRSGFELGVPYYWNIAPNRDATLMPVVRTRRGLALNSEYRYLEPSFRGQLNLDLLPDDRVAGRSRYLLQFLHDGDAGAQVHYRAEGLRVSDDDYWKDFSGGVPSFTPRLLPINLLAERRFGFGDGDWKSYARVQQWQVLQAVDSPIVEPYQRAPQVGVQGLGALPGGLAYSFETEVNRFTRPDGFQTALLANGTRWHAVGSVSRPWRAPGWWIEPKLSLNTAVYDTDRPMADGRTSASRTVPTFSVDTGLLFEREASFFGRPMRQTLEPRLFYVNTPYRQQSNLPDYDSAGKDFNYESIYSDNNFTGVDRVSDAHQVTAGVTTRWIDPASGAEALRLGVAQRYLFRDQRITPNPDGTPDGPPFTERLSDLLLLGTANLSPKWSLDTSLQYSTDLNRTTRSVVAARYSPGPFQTISAGYRFTRDLTEQVELGWQWPVYRAEGASEKGAQPNGSCRGTLYGVGRVNYSTRDARLTDAIAGFEYDAGCWIGRVVAERLSTGRSEATTRLLLQLELVGLSRLGTNPLKALRDNIPGYRLLRDEPGAAKAPPVYE